MDDKLLLSANGNYTEQLKRPRVLSGLETYTGPWDAKAVTHLLRRTVFGATKNDIDALLQVSMDAAVDALLDNSYNPPPLPVNDYNNGTAIDPDIPSGSTWINAPFSPNFDGYRTISLTCWWFRLMLHQGKSIREKMTMFWHNHLPVIMTDVFPAAHNYRYLDMLRVNALGNFKTIIKKLTLNPAMLHFLNGVLNSKDAPDENYAREIQELFCIGKDLPNHYTEEDVREAARLLTGWRVNETNFTSYFNPAEHDTGNKTFSSFYNNRTITGRSGPTGGETELDEFLDMLFAHPECARFICRKIYRFFVYHDIDTAAEQNMIVPMAGLLRAGNYEVLPVLKTLFKSAHFFDTANRGAVLKSPVDFLIGMLRQFNVSMPASNPLFDNLYLSFQLSFHMTQTLQTLGNPPNVAGWPAYYQSPQFDKYWITTDTLPRRGKMASTLINEAILAPNSFLHINVLVFTHTLTNPENPNLLVQQVTDLMLGHPVSQLIKDHFKKILLSNQSSDSYWTAAWAAYISNPNDAVARGIVETRLKQFYLTVLQTSEYQLM